ncbi:hypothetical protein [Streptomyces sp. NPDC055709]
MQGIGLRPKVYVSADGSGVVGHGARLLADLADATGLTAVYSAALGPLRPRGTGHDPGRIAADLAVMLADGGEALSDLTVLRDQAEVFAPIASTPTAWRLLADTDERALASLRSARASAREVAWLQAAEHGEGIPAVRGAGRMVTLIHQRPLEINDRRSPGHWEGDRATRSSTNLSGLPDWRGS